MRTLLLLLFLANLALGIVAMAIGPPELATHFGPGGEPNGWGSNVSNTLIMGGMSVLMFAMFFGAPYIIRWTPDQWMNLPNRDYWLAEERRDHSLAVMAQQLYAIGAATFALMLAVGFLALQANLADPVRLQEKWMWAALGLYFAYTIYWCAKLYLGFRIPVDSSGRPDA